VNTVIILGLTGVALLLVDLLWEDALRPLRLVALAGLVAALAAPATGLGNLAHDRLVTVLGDTAVLAAAAPILLPPPLHWHRRISAYLALTLWAAAGMVLLAGASDFLLLFLGLELLSLPLYALTGFSLDGPGTEAALKYFLLGGLASGLVLLGGALAYAATGSVSLSAWHGPLLGVSLVAVGLAFKLALVPLHSWSPDAYQGAPTPVAAFMAVGTKAAAFAALARLLAAAPGALELIGLLAVLSMFAGYLLAIPQTRLSRLLAYSGVAHAGTFALALLASKPTAALLYLPAYGAATVGVFVVAGVMGDDLASLTGLARQRPWLGVAVGACLLSLASVPPTGVFVAKLLLLSALFAAGYGLLAVLIALATVVGLYPYFKVAALLVADGGGRPPRLDPASVALLAASAIFAIGLGLVPAWLLPH